MSAYVYDFQEIDKTKLMLVGGKGANLGELSRIDGIQVPEGFCVTTAAYKEIIDGNREYRALLNQLSPLNAEDKENISTISAKIREIIENIAIPYNIGKEITEHLKQFGENTSYAVRSSATAEDLPTASFAGQQDTYLNIIGTDSILKHISQCWASLFTDRAVTYRIQNGFDHGKVQLSVVVQKMVFPEAAGILFTADPVTGNRKVVSIDAGFGLGEALVSGMVTADNYKVRNGAIIDKKISVKKLAIYAVKEGGTEERLIEPDKQAKQTLADRQILELEKISRRIEAHFGLPQDIEWCLYENKFYIVQSRPITTLYPLPKDQGDKGRIYMSFGHQQMMTDAMKPLGLSVFQYSGGNGTLMAEAGGRLFIDLTHDMASTFGRSLAIASMGAVDPLIKSGLKDLAKRKDFMKSLARGKRFLSMSSGYFSWSLVTGFLKVYRSGDEHTVPALIKKNEEGIKALEAKFAVLSGDDVFAAADEELKQLLKIIGDPQGLACVWTGALSASQINKKVEKWLGEKRAADILALSAPNSVAGEMGLGLLAVSDAARQYPAVIEFLKTAKPEGAGAFYNELGKLEGGKEISEAIRKFLQKFGARCSGEIDISKPRWIEEPSALAAMILGNIENFGPGAHNEIHERDLKKAEEKERDILSRLSGGKMKKAKKMIRRLRNFIGYREYPKFVMVQRYWIIKQALIREAERLVQCGVFREIDDMCYLSFNELREAVRKQDFDYNTILKRKEEFAVCEKLSPPRLMTSEGEIVGGEYVSAKAPKGAILGIAASSGIVEGRARVILRLEDAKLSKGDILVTKFTDPSWTPVFVSISGLVAEVGGIATHGSVVAREYGLPAVVGADNATRLIKDGQRIRVNGTDGYVEIL
jgi:pyruvate,water dikinase